MPRRAPTVHGLISDWIVVVIDWILVFGSFAFVLAMAVYLISELVCICELQSKDVFFIEAVALKSVDH